MGLVHKLVKIVIVGSLVVVGPAGGMQMDSTEHQEGSSTIAPSDAWQTLETEHFRIHYKSGYRADARTVLNYSRFAREEIREFWDFSLSVKTDIYLHPATEWDRGQYSMYAHSSYWGGNESYDADIHLLTLSNMSVPESLTREDHINRIKRLITHEYVQVPLYENKYTSEGYNIRLPDWFRQGISEYVSAFQTTDQIQTLWEERRETVRELIKDGNGYLFAVAGNRYRGGAQIVRFMADQYGWETPRTLFTTGEYPNFYAALRAETGDSIPEFREKWRSWAEQNIGGNYSIRPDGDPIINITVIANGSSAKDATDSVSLGVKSRNAPIKFGDRKYTPKASGDITTESEPNGLQDPTTHPNDVTSADTWQTLETEHFRIHYKSGYRADARTVLNYTRLAREEIREFWNFSLSTKTDVYVNPASEWNRPQYTMFTRGGFPEENGIHLLAPSDMTIPDHYTREEHLNTIKQLIAHEYTQIPLYQKRAGGNSVRLPDWFRQGISEYVSAFQTTDQIQTWWLDRYQHIRDTIKDGNGYLFAVAGDRYRGGAHIVKFMVDQYGWDTPLTLFTTSEYRDFYAALKAETGDSIPEFRKKWRSWAERNIGGNYSTRPESGPKIHVTVVANGSAFNAGERARVSVSSEIDPSEVTINFDDQEYTPNASGEIMLPLDDPGTRDLTVGYRNTTASTQLTVLNEDTIPPLVGDNPPINVDNDSLLEDVNGDGDADFSDAISLAFNLDSAAEYPEHFDYNRDGQVDFRDAVALAFSRDTS